MSALFQKLGTRYTNYMLRQGRYQARHALLSQSNLVLEDLGISRDLLEAGIDSWPWKTKVDQPEPVVITQRFSLREEKLAIRQLRALSNRELSDIGISRSGIVDAVRNGRTDHNDTTLAGLNLTALANQAISSASVDMDDTAANAPLSKNSEAA